MKPDASVLAGDGLHEVCETVGMPPVLGLGSCVDNSRSLLARAGFFAAVQELQIFGGAHG
jgi:carbon-monoxide dehydrogenase catalytic subunit